MRKSLPMGWLAVLLSMAIGPAFAETAVARGAHADVNGIRMYYEQHGPTTGVPLVLLHGGVALLERLHVEQADLFGFSNGASVALQVAIRHPQAVRNLIFASAMTRRDGARPELWTFIDKGDFSTMPQPLKDAFLKVTPDPARLRAMHDKDAARMRGFRDLPDADVKSIRARTLVLIGDRDVVKPEHAVELTRLIPGARLMILPGGHGDYIGDALTKPEPTNYPELTAALVAAFIG